MKEKSAIVFGTFSTAAQGHIDFWFRRRSVLTTKVRVVVSGYQETVEGNGPISARSLIHVIRVKTFIDDGDSRAYKLGKLLSPVSSGFWNH